MSSKLRLRNIRALQVRNLSPFPAHDDFNPASMALENAVDLIVSDHAGLSPTQSGRISSTADHSYDNIDESHVRGATQAFSS